MAETFQVTARKWRPMRFDDVVGQDHVTRTLKNAIREGRLAHAYLFTGQRGCGKTTVARLLAKAINCPNAAAHGYEPCNECDVCISITEGRSMDVSEIDGASNNGVDDVRSLRDNVRYPPVQGTYKVIIIDEVHMLSTQAFNALLKTLEEPPKHLVFVFATTEVQKVLPTILSRTQRYDFRRMQIDEITGRLRTIADADKIEIDDDALLVIAKKADGSMRDAQSIFDQVVAFTGMKVETARVRDALNLIDADFFFEVTDAIVDRTAARAFDLAQSIMTRGYDIEEFFAGLLEHFRNILTALVTRSTKLIEAAKVHQERYATASEQFSEGDILRLVRLGQSALERLKTSVQPRVVLELTLVEMMLMERAMEIQSLLAEVRALRSMTLPSAAPTSAPAEPAAPTRARPRVTNGASAVSELHETPHAQEIAPEPVKKPEPAREGASFSARADEAATRTTSKPAASSGSQSVQITESTQVLFDAPERIASEWDAFVHFLGTKSRPIFMAIGDMHYCGMRRNSVYIGGSTQQSVEILQRYKDVVMRTLREYFSFEGLLVEVGEVSEMRARSGMPVVENPEVVRRAISSAVPRNKAGQGGVIAETSRAGAFEQRSASEQGVSEYDPYDAGPYGGGQDAAQFDVEQFDARSATVVAPNGRLAQAAQQQAKSSALDVELSPFEQARVKDLGAQLL